MVADCDRYKIVLLNNQLQEKRDVITEENSQVKLWGAPKRLYYNELTSQLYVAHRLVTEIHNGKPKGPYAVSLYN